METIVVDQSSWGIVRVSGNDRVRFMQGMVIGDVAKLGVGQWLRTAMLNVKGRVLSIFDLIARDDHLLLICHPGQARQTIAALSKFAIVDDVEFAEVNEPVHRVWEQPASVWTAEPVFSSPADASSEEQVEIRRIEGGLPLYGIDVTDANFPFESLLATLVDYDKGCYIGQEPIHRVHAKGQSQKMLRGLRFEGEAPLVGTVVVHPERANAGTITSRVSSPEFGPIALALLHRMAFTPGDTVTCDGQPATVVELPFRLGNDCQATETACQES